MASIEVMLGGYKLTKKDILAGPDGWREMYLQTRMTHEGDARALGEELAEDYPTEDEFMAYMREQVRTLTAAWLQEA